ncbi:aspartate/glutamate racemase family protein [Streptomyces phaeochromogenes]|uniref:Aspartate/glutamate racemase family protein n=1 Tax=Streptomyces phaeochromogenes TaxID=1923 RepID=A0ABZ1H701_STRPH|nr:aspartate/glutamate racemase family protein [Streptomyces phaeochromogenes]WSD13146.1 aspartate/glutamate racemase family protein [Streptomyces phaeochromogenes]
MADRPPGPVLMGPLALLHTSPVHIPVFEALRDEDHPALELRHFVSEELLERARAEGPEAVTDEVRAMLDRAVADGAVAVLCTCSTIGAVAEAARPGVPVLRVDRPMAAAAVAAGPRVVVLATVESTLGPTVALVEEEAVRAGSPTAVRTLLAADAWDHFAAGDMDAYARAVASAADSVTDADAIVLAQASMTPAQHLTTTAVPVLSSPRPGLAAGAVAAGGA